MQMGWRDRLRRSVRREIRPDGSIRRIAVQKLKEHIVGEWMNPAGLAGGSRRKKRPWSEWRPGFGNMAERSAHEFNIGGFVHGRDTDEPETWPSVSRSYDHVRGYGV